jgi:DNA-binding SARP family transcriptional activator/streptogramin lyase
MEFRVLGPVEVLTANVPIAMPAGRQRALLALLLIHRDASVSTDRIVEELWPSGAPPTAAKIVRNHISELRKALADGGAGVTIATEARGYRLRVEPSRIDARRFEDLVAEGRRLRETGKTDRAAQALEEALSLWHGAPFENLADEAFVRGEAARLEELRLTCLEERIDADLELGRHAEVIPELEALVRQEPLRERLRELLMLALYRAGRQAEALAAYRDVRRGLRDELGLDPGRGLQELERAILAQDRSLDPPARRQAVAMRRRGGVLVVLGALARAAAAGGLALALDDRGAAKGLTGLSPNSIGAIDPATGRIVAQVPLGAAAAHLAASSDTLWALSTTERTLYRVDAGRRELTGSGRLDGVVADVAAIDDEVWVVHAGRSGAAVVTRFTGDQAAPLRLDSFEPGSQLLGAGGASFGVAADVIAVGDDTVWVTASAVHPGSLLALDRDSGRMRDRLPGAVYGLALDADAAWLVAEQLLRRVDTEAMRIDLEIVLPSPGVAVAVAVGEGAVWALTSPDVGVQWTQRLGRGVLTRVDPETTAVATTIELGGRPEAVTAGLGSVWITDVERNALIRVDPRSNDVVDRIQLGARPRDVVTAGGLVWVAVS